jgi:hypothetical protein
MMILSHRSKVAVCVVLSVLVQLALIAVGNHDLPAHVAPYLEYLRNTLMAAGLYYLPPPADSTGVAAPPSGPDVAIQGG